MPRLRLLYLIPASAALLVPGIALAHGGEASESGWSFEPLAAVLLTCSVALYALGWARMRASARQVIAPWWRVSAYVAAVVTLIIALFSPLDAGADHLKALARVSRALRDAQFVAKLRGAGSTDAMYVLLARDEARDAA